jgi:hypothetical protein
VALVDVVKWDRIRLNADRASRARWKNAYLDLPQWARGLLVAVVLVSMGLGLTAIGGEGGILVGSMTCIIGLLMGMTVGGAGGDAKRRR